MNIRRLAIACFFAAAGLALGGGTYALAAGDARNENCPEWLYARYERCMETFAALDIEEIPFMSRWELERQRTLVVGCKQMVFETMSAKQKNACDELLIKRRLGVN